jgi:hypothetical protein
MVMEPSWEARENTTLVSNKTELADKETVLSGPDSRGTDKSGRRRNYCRKYGKAQQQGSSHLICGRELW